MARLLPHFDPSAITQPGERKVAEALCAQLGPDVVIFHSYPWLRPERHERSQKEILHEGEADFVIVHPRFGILVVEVKGGHVFYDARTMRWERRGAKHQMKDPFAQASRSMHALEKLAQERQFKAGLPFARGYCAVFPDCEWSGTPPPGAVNNNLFSARDLAQLGGRIESLFRSFDRRSEHKALPASVLDGIVRTLTSEFKLTPALWREIEEQEKILFRFTEEQVQMLDLLSEHKRAAVQGVAGSGKTQLALVKAKNFADQGLRVLLLCYNRMLGDWLSEQTVGYENKIVATNYHRLAREWCDRAKVPFNATLSDDNDFWTTEAAQRFENAIERLEDDRFDAVVVDEGQDFHSSWWDSVEWLNRDLSDGRLYVFYDPSQRLQYAQEQTLPRLGTPFVLPCNCRNTQNISRLCSMTIGRDIRVKPGTPEGRKPETYVADNPEAQKQAVARCLKTWLSGAGSLTPKHIVILSPGSPAQSSLRNFTSLSGVRLTDDLTAWRENQGVLLTSVRKFKGLEADAVILFDVSKETDASLNWNTLYVAISRAKHLLTIISFAPDERLDVMAQNAYAS